MTTYEYYVTSHNGAGVYSKHRTLKDAKAAAQKVIEQGHTLSPLEIERVLDVGYGRRYWMQRGSRWEIWDPHRDATIRKPAFILEPQP